MKLPRNWCARMKFKGCSEFYLGTVQAESDLEAERQLQDLWKSLIPVPTEHLEYLYPVPGIMIFVED